MSNFSLDTSNLQEKSEGELFSRQDYNALVRAIKSLVELQEGLSGGGLKARADKPPARPDYFSTKTRGIIPEYAGLSFEPEATALPSEPSVQMQSVKSTNKTNNNLYITNEGVKSTGESEMNFGGRIISQYVLTQLEVDDTVPPEIGKVCGIENDTFKVTHDGTGLLCTNLYTESGVNYATVVAVSGVVNFLVKASSVVAKDTTGDFIVWYGTPGAEVESSPKIIYKAVNKTASDITPESPPNPSMDKFYLMLDINGSRYIFSKGLVEVYHLFSPAIVTAGASTSMLLPNGNTEDVINWTDDTINTSDRIRVMQDTDTELWYMLKGGGAGEDQMDIVQVMSPQADGVTCLWSGGVVVPNAATSYCTDQFPPSGGSCHITVLNQASGSTGTKDDLQVGEEYIGKRVGVLVADGFPIYAIRTAGEQGTQVLRFELILDLLFGVEPSSPNAQLITWGGAGYIKSGTDITVFDMVQYGYEGIAYTAPTVVGSRGWCQKMGDRDVYEVIWMQRIAHQIMFSLDELITTPKGTVDAWFDGTRPTADPDDSVDINDQYQFFTRTNEFSRGIAIRNEQFKDYLPVVQETFAGVIEYRADVMDDGNVGITVNVNLITEFYGGQTDTLDPSDGDLIAEKQVAVFNNGMFIHGRQDGDGIALFDTNADIYRTIVLDQAAILVLGEASLDWATEDSLIQLSSADPLTPFPFLEDTNPGTARNVFNTEGNLGDKVLLVYDQANRDYIGLIPNASKVQPRVMRGVIQGDFVFTSPAVNVTPSYAYDGDPVPGVPVSVLNQDDLAGEAGDTCIFIERLLSGSVISYELIQIKHKMRELIEDCDWDNETSHALSFNKQRILCVDNDPDPLGWAVCMQGTLETFVHDTVFDGTNKFTNTNHVSIMFNPADTLTPTNWFTSDFITVTEFVSYNPTTGVMLYRPRNIHIIKDAGAGIDQNLFTSVDIQVEHNITASPTELRHFPKTIRVFADGTPGTGIAVHTMDQIRIVDDVNKVTSDPFDLVQDVRGSVTNPDTYVWAKGTDPVEELVWAGKACS